MKVIIRSCYKRMSWHRLSNTTRASLRHRLKGFSEAKPLEPSLAWSQACNCPHVMVVLHRCVLVID